MRTITQLNDDIAILVKKLGDMQAVCVAENRDADEEERGRANEYLNEIDELESILAIEVRAQETLDRLKKPSAKPDKTPLPTKKEQRDRDSFASNGEFLQAVMRAGVPGGKVDPRLSTRAATGLSESIPSDGGFLVDSEMSGGILKNIWETSPILSRVSKVTLTGNKTGMKFNGLDETSRATGSRAGGITGYWKSEAALKTASKPKFRQIELNLNKLIGLCYATDELLDDAAALEQTIREGFRAEFDFLLADAIINGSGAGQPLGIINSGCMVSVGKETGQAADTIVYENVLKMWSRLMASSRPDSIWLINQNCEPQLHQMSLAVGTGGAPVYLPVGGASASPYSTLFGRPVIPVEHCPVLGDTGDIILADFSQYKAIDKGGMQGDVSIHVQFIYDESVFRFVYRFDGQPVLASAITPFTAGATTATDTLSHFVKLDARG
jgi:HK97 family phage major capsid protein